MILHHRSLAARPTVFTAMTGLSPARFDDLLDDVAPRLAELRRQRRHRPGRRRAPGAGHPYELSVTDQILLTVVWLRLYPGGEVLGYLFGVSKATVSRHIAEILPLLEAAGRDTMRLPDPGPGHRRSLDQLIEGVPGLAVLVDSFEQPVQRPRDRAEADRWYSGKKRMHTIKAQVAVDATTGLIVAVCGDAVGPFSDLTLLAASGLARQLDPAVELIGDGAYVGMAEFRRGGRATTPRRKPRGSARPPEDVEYNRVVARRRVVVEHRIGGLRTYQALAQRDRHHRRHHERRVVAVAGLVNRRLGWTAAG